LIMLLPTFSLLFLVPKNWFSLVKLLPDWKTFWPCFAAGFFLSFYPFWLPRYILFLHSSRFDLAVASIFSVSFCPEGHVQQMMYRIGRGFQVLALQLILELSYLAELPFHIHRFCLRTCKLLLLPTFSYLFLVPKDWSSSVRLLSVWLPFRFILYRIFLSGFLAEWALRWLFSIPYQNLLWSCCRQHFLCSFLSRGTGLDLHNWYRIGKLSRFLPCGWFPFSFPVQPGLSVSDPFKSDNVSFLLLPEGFPHFPCH
jgi:hypothetical protein